MKPFQILLIILIFCISGCGRSPSGIAVINIDEIFKNYKKSQKINEELDKEKRELESRGQQMMDEINTLVKESELLSEETRKERETRIGEKTAALELYRRNATRELMGKTNLEYQKLMADVQVAAEAVAKKHKVKVILDGSSVVYGEKSLDVTKDIIEELNRNFDKQPLTEKST